METTIGYKLGLSHGCLETFRTMAVCCGDLLLRLWVARFFIGSSNKATALRSEAAVTE